MKGRIIHKLCTLWQSLMKWKSSYAATTSELFAKTETMLWSILLKHNIAVIIPGDKHVWKTTWVLRTTCCWTPQSRPADRRLPGSVHSSSLWSTRKHSKHDAPQDAKFPALPRCSRADILKGRLQSKSYLPTKAAICLLFAHTAEQETRLKVPI